jgi:hypothetical protein
VDFFVDLLKVMECDGEACCDGCVVGCNVS